MEKKSKIKFNIIIIIAIILFAIGTIPKTFQEDTYYMIKVGEYICQNGMEVIENRIEPFAWQEGMIYTYPHWLLDVVFYGLFSTFDIFGVYIFTVLMGVGIYLLIYYTNVKVGKNNIISAIITIASIYLLSGYMAARSQMITYICCILTILLIERFLENGKKRYLIGLILVPILLANCHAALFPIYFVIYLPYIAEYAISFFRREERYTRKIKRNDKTIEKLKEKVNLKTEENTKKAERRLKKIQKKENSIARCKEKLNKIHEKEKIEQSKIIIEKNKNVKWLMIVFVIAIFTGLLTPLKDIPYTYMIKSLIGNTMHYISEHQAVTLIGAPTILGTFAIIVILLFSNKIKVRLQDLFMLGGMSILALISYKQFPIFLICTMCIVNKMINMLLTENGKEKVKKLVEKVLSIKGMIYVILVIVIIFLLQYKEIASQSYIDSNEYPVQATNWLKSNVDISKMKLFNDFNYGSYLLFKNVPVFIDGRADVYDPMFNGKEDDIFTDYMSTTSLQVWYEDIFKKYGITHIITKTDDNLNIFLQRNIDYKSIYNDGTFSIYESVERK